MCGFYFVNGAQNDYAGNSLLGNGAPEFPTPPSLAVTSPASGSTVNGTVTISWSQSGQSLAYTTVMIDGVSNTATGTSFLWNTTSLADGEHTVVVNVTDTGGFSTSQTLLLFTNNQLLATEATISSLNQTLESLNATLQNLQSQLGSLNKTLLKVSSQVGSINATLQSTQADVNGMKNDGYIAIAVVIAAIVAAAVTIIARRRQKAQAQNPAPSLGS